MYDPTETQAHDEMSDELSHATSDEMSHNLNYFLLCKDEHIACPIKVTERLTTKIYAMFK